MLPDCFSSSWVWWWRRCCCFEQIYGAASAHLWGANRCGGDKRGDGVRDTQRERKWVLETIPVPSRSQIKKENHSLFPVHLKMIALLVYDREREKCESALYQLCLDQLNMGRFCLEELQSDHHSRKSRCYHVGKHTTYAGHVYRGESHSLSQ